MKTILHFKGYLLMVIFSMAILTPLQITAQDWNEIIKVTAPDAHQLGYYGKSVSISGETALVGATGDWDNGAGSGAVYVYVRSGNTWIQQAKLKASDGYRGDNFGTSVCISGDVALVGARKAHNGNGAAYVFVRSGATWTQQAKLIAADGDYFDEFGSSVSISEDTALVGAYAVDDYGNDVGSAYVFVRSGTTWTQQAKLTALDGEALDYFGYSVSISGETALVGAWGDGDNGASYVFARSGTTWAQEAKLTASDGEFQDRFGTTVSISGDRAIIGAHGDDEIEFNAGAAYVFVRSNSIWVEQVKLTAADANYESRFGGSVSISGDTAIVGSSGDDENEDNSGAAYMFVYSGSIWDQHAKLKASDGTGGDRFGGAVSISGDFALVGTPIDNHAGSYSGSAYFFEDLIAIAPEISCPENITVQNDINQCGAIVTFAAIDDVGYPDSIIDYSIETDSETIAIESGYFFQVGTTTVTSTATNEAGTSSCTFNVIVNDTEVPVADIATLPNVIVKHGATVTAPTATDNCGGTITATTDADFPITEKGLTIITWVYDDGNGNSVIQSQNVVVNKVKPHEVVVNHYPNPFIESINFAFKVPYMTNFNISIYNQSGYLTTELTNGIYVNNGYEVNWNANNVIDGVYFYKLLSNGLVVGKGTILKSARSGN